MHIVIFVVKKFHDLANFRDVAIGSVKPST